MHLFRKFKIIKYKRKSIFLRAGIVSLFLITFLIIALILPEGFTMEGGYAVLLGLLFMMIIALAYFSIKPYKTIGQLKLIDKEINIVSKGEKHHLNVHDIKEIELFLENDDNYALFSASEGGRNTIKIITEEETFEYRLLFRGAHDIGWFKIYFKFLEKNGIGTRILQM